VIKEEELLHRPRNSQQVFDNQTTSTVIFFSMKFNETEGLAAATGERERERDRSREEFVIFFFSEGIPEDGTYQTA